MTTYIVTCTNTYRINADNQEDAVKIAHALDNREDYDEQLGSGKNIDSDTEVTKAEDQA